jgi:SPP1 gp7 family putative phage head morphogenesis protein
LLAIHATWGDHVETIAREFLGHRGDATGPASPAGSLEAQLSAAYDAVLQASGLERWLQRFGGKIVDGQARYVERVARVRPEAVARQPELEAFRQRNVALVTNMSREQSAQIADILRPAQAVGARWETIAPQIQERLGVGRSRAKLIARDQTNKFNSDMAQAHQTAAGISEYVWRTARDFAVRGRPGGEYAKSKENHWALEGTRHAWASPPLIPGTAVHANPGQQIQCRCVAVPVVEFFE